MENKFDVFFILVKDFSKRLDLVLEKDDLSEGEFYVDSLINGRQLSKSIISYLYNFTTLIKFKNNGIGEALFDVKSISKCEYMAKEKGIVAKIKNVQTVSGWEDQEAKCEKNEILFLKYDDIGSSYLFTDNCSDNPILYLYWEGDEVTSEGIVFTSFVRNAIFWELVRTTHPHKGNLGKNLSIIPWLKFYLWLFQNDKNARNKLITWRQSFNRSMVEKQREINILLGIDEYEVEFIKYLVEEKGVENIQSIFNPYIQVVTFKEQ